MIEISLPSSTRGTITLHSGDSFNLSTGNVIRGDRTNPGTERRPVVPAGTIMDHMLGNNNLAALALFFRNNTR